MLKRLLNVLLDWCSSDGCQLGRPYFGIPRHRAIGSNCFSVCASGELTQTGLREGLKFPWAWPLVPGAPAWWPSIHVNLWPQTSGQSPQDILMSYSCSIKMAGNLWPGGTAFNLSTKTPVGSFSCWEEGSPGRALGSPITLLWKLWSNTACLANLHSVTEY